jgi:hypothetical protein
MMLTHSPTSVAKIKKACSDVDENLDSAFIVVPIAAMAVMLNKRMMVMMFVKPTRVVMVISQGATCTDGDEENSQG